MIVRSDLITREVIEAAGKLKIVVRAGAGYDNIDLEAASERGIVVMNTPGQNSNAVAELALGMMVYMARNQFNGTSEEN
jgi:D-3-phosphoglycerate dehydrogenase / 2-oxoglutarate reductase